MAKLTLKTGARKTTLSSENVRAAISVAMGNDAVPRVQPARGKKTSLKQSTVTKNGQSIQLIEQTYNGNVFINCPSRSVIPEVNHSPFTIHLLYHSLVFTFHRNYQDDNFPPSMQR